MRFFEDAIKKLDEYKKLSTCLNKNSVPIGVTGVSLVHKAHIVHALQAEKNKKIFVVAADETEANKLVNDLTFMGSRTFLYNSKDFIFRDIEGMSLEYVYKRLEVLYRILNNEFDVIVTCIDAALQYTIPKNVLSKGKIKISLNDNINPDEFIKNLIDFGYASVERVDDKGQFSVRGGIIDVFIPCESDPIRIELWGNSVDTISYFDVDSQRRNDSIDSITITLADEVIISDPVDLAEKINTLKKNLRTKSASTAKNILSQELEKIENHAYISSKDKFISLIYDSPSTLFDYMSTNDVVVISEQKKISDRYNNIKWQWSEDLKSCFENGVLCKGLDKYSEDIEYAYKKIQRHSPVFLDTFIHNSYPVRIKETVNFTATQMSTWNGSVKILVEDLQLSKDSKDECTVILAGTTRSAMSTYEGLSSLGFNVEHRESLDDVVKGKIIVLPGSLSAGFEYPSINIKLITHGHYYKPKTKKQAKYKSGKSIYNLSELSNGDYVVHYSHGIGVFRGIKKISMNGVIKDYITLEYAKGDILYVPVTQLDLVSKYIGSNDNANVKLNKLGNNEWKQTKARAKANAKDIANHLIKLYSERMRTDGYAFSQDNEWQKDFEAHFEYEETQDQLRCIEEIKQDMQKEVPMDRLLCGDVGFGKTEIALRAAFKCVCDSKQCAMLVPTTILSWQHYQTVCKRFEGFDVRVELLSRFRSARQQQEIIEKVRRGEIDMVIGTHRLIQDDVKFRDLGLLIIDEEQRFGVKQKEHFKEHFKNVDILTLSATPIPRTLNMAMSGIRDMSMLEEAPQNRYPVQTYVLEHDRGIIHEAIRKELRRGGQVFYLHNRVDSIENTAASIQSDIPEAKVKIGHGRMSENELSDVWKQMIDQEINVLVCTTIIETGIDLPNVNTLIIENADCMGLSQLHQLRGRVGRSSRRAYAYFTFQKNKSISDLSQKRLSAIRDFTEFGSGFKISLRDLEIRGAGNILGGEQHGYMSDVGYDMYIRLLNEAVSEKKGQKTNETQNECLVDVQVSAHIPEKYIRSTSERVDIYRRISDIKTEEDASDVIYELIDRFGEPPKSVKGLIDVAIIRNLAMKHKIYEVKQINDELRLFQDDIDLDFFTRLVSIVGKDIKINASKKPFISVKIKKGSSPTNALKKMLS